MEPLNLDKEIKEPKQFLGGIGLILRKIRN
jgi:hypothetical protein